jgi:hypothetical protein
MNFCQNLKKIFWFKQIDLNKIFKDYFLMFKQIDLNKIFALFLPSATENLQRFLEMALRADCLPVILLKKTEIFVCLHS